PKLRGVLGEVFLRDLLMQLVPTCCEFQYRFKSGELVDAVIKIGERFVPVDAKFPLENFRKMLEPEMDEKTKATYKRTFIADVKKHVDAVASKYILPDEGTYDFALMYIPAENVYYETITKNQGEDFSIADYAIQKRVIPVSPNTIYAYLQVIMFGLRGLKVEKHAEEILHHLARLKGDFEKFNGDFEVLGSHISNAAKKYDEAEKRLDRFGDKLSLSGQIAPVESGEVSESVVELPAETSAQEPEE
ncbi:MAG: DNA recombination protein RmuC, partial [Candidatus Subteraquimicrobiales bacterium]|nr:DNA recombination protein RmuC [Candidatus Subteraquimicrobiales bacterium]